MTILKQHWGCSLHTCGISFVCYENIFFYLKRKSTSNNIYPTTMELTASFLQTNKENQ